MKITPKNHENAAQDFNEDWARQVTEQEFVSHMVKAGVWSGISSREENLRAAWRLIRGEADRREAAIQKAAATGTDAKGEAAGVPVGAPPERRKPEKGK